jgi:GWxTD domain-containing protein
MDGESLIDVLGLQGLEFLADLGSRCPMKRVGTNAIYFFFLLVGLLFPGVPRAQDQQPPSDQKTENKQSSREQKKREKKLLKELDTPYRKWLDEDVSYIIMPEERSAFLKLSTNEEREQFIEQFWLRRDPTPDTVENEFKEEHYRRIAYANEHYASGIPGWKTDRGRIYIMWGPADEIESHPSGGSYTRPPEEGGGETSTYPFEKWRYRYLEGIGEDINLEFVDTTMTGEYRLTMDPSEKDALLYIPGAGLTQLEAMGQASKADRFSNTDGTHLGRPIGGRPSSMDEFNRLELYAKVQRPPEVKFKDLETLVTSRIVRNQLPFDYRFDFLRVTSDTVLVPVTVQVANRQMSFQEKNGVETGVLNVFGRVSTLTGRVVQTFEDPVTRDIPESLLQQSLKGFSIYQKALPLRPGLYRLDIVVKDVNSGNVGVVNTRLAVPRYDEDRLASSTLILADQLQPVSAREIGLGQFVLGDRKVRPKLDGVFKTDEKMGLYFQVYNLKVDEKTHKSNASVEYRVLKDKQSVLDLVENSQQLGQTGEQLTIEKQMALDAFAPGHYKLEIQVTDHLDQQTLKQTADFTVKPAEKVGTAK